MIKKSDSHFAVIQFCNYSFDLTYQIRLLYFVLWQLLLILYAIPFRYRQILRPTSLFDTKGKFLSNLRAQFTSGLVSLSGAVSQRDVAEFYKFLKADYHLGAPRMCQFVKHVGHQRNNEWFIYEEVHGMCNKTILV